MILQKILCIVITYCCLQATQGQITMPTYTIREESPTHLTVIHVETSELRRIKADADTDAVIFINPEIKIRNGSVDHKGMTGELYVRAYYVDSVLIGYVEYDGSAMKREIYYNADGNIFLEKRYKGNDLVYTNANIQTKKLKKTDGRNTK